MYRIHAGLISNVLAGRANSAAVGRESRRCTPTLSQRGKKNKKTPGGITKHPTSMVRARDISKGRKLALLCYQRQVSGLARKPLPP